MIVRILGEGQFDVPAHEIGRLNNLDDAVTAAVDSGTADTFAVALLALIAAIHTAGAPLPDDALQPSDGIVPAPDSSVEEVRELLRGDGLIPG